MNRVFNPLSSRARLLAVALASVAPLAAVAAAPAPATTAERYTLDPAHTFPSFEADHWGLSVWRGKFNRSRGAVVVDLTHATGTLDVTIDMTSVDFGLDAMNETAVEPDLLDTNRCPRYRRAGGPKNCPKFGEATDQGGTQSVDRRFVVLPPLG